MKIKVEREKIIKAMKKLEEIEIVLETPDDAKEAIDIVLRRTDLFNSDHYKKLKEINVTSIQEYKTSAVNYNITFMLEFVFEKEASINTKIEVIKEFQTYFEKL
jgi:hypothetical protein